MKTLMAGLLLVGQLGTALAVPRGIPENENPTPMLEGQRLIISLQDMARQGLHSGASAIDLWSGPYWPHYQGGLGSRYRDQGFMALMQNEAQYPKFQAYVSARPSYVYRNNLDTLSPAEKYDMLVGDKDFTLTKYSWEIGEKARVGNKVPIWRGICDGWASASQMMPRPKKAVTLQSPYGEAITFYPEDIKALGSQLYARAQSNPHFFGKRCHSSLLFFTSACQGTNAAAFHLALVNRVGVLKRSFIADISPGSEVWNYPVKDYAISFYNVFSDKESDNFIAAMEGFDKKKRFKKRDQRHPSTRYIVGVKAVVNYTDMRDPHVLPQDSVAQDKILQKTYYYDLELDYRFNIVGGEKSSGDFPDFFWAPNDGTYPPSLVESRRGAPRGSAEVLSHAQEASKAGQPLSHIVERLFEASK